MPSAPVRSRVRRASRTPAIPAIKQTADDGVPGRLAQRRGEDRLGEVVRHEERRQGHDDEEVEEQHPARDEAGEIVECPADERRRAPGLGNRRRPLRVGEGNHEEERAREQQDERRQTEGCGGDDPEGDVERGRDLAVGDREERGCVEDALEAAELTSHDASARE